MGIGGGELSIETGERKKVIGSPLTGIRTAIKTVIRILHYIESKSKTSITPTAVHLSLHCLRHDLMKLVSSHINTNRATN